MSLFRERDFIPMLLNETEKPFDHEDYLFEIKFDGIRALLFVSPNEIEIRNRKGRVINRTYPELLEITKNVKKNCIFDGEIVLLKNGVPDFSLLLKRELTKDEKKIEQFKIEHPVVFVCFDIIYEDNDLTNLPLIERKKILDNYKDTNEFVKTIYLDEKGKKLYQLTKKQNLEGIIAKRKDSKYSINTRSNDWLKIKHWLEDDFFICAYDENEGKNVASLILGRKIKNHYELVSKVSIGKRNLAYKEILKQKKVESYFEVSDTKFQFIEPNLKARISFLERTQSGGLRQPIFKGLRSDL